MLKLVRVRPRQLLRSVETSNVLCRATMTRIGCQRHQSSMTTEPPVQTCDPKSKTREYAWQHPIYSAKEYEEVQIAHRNAESMSDYVALGALRVMRKSFDLATGYRHHPTIFAQQNENEPGSHSTATRPHQSSTMTYGKWLTRFVFLESIAGVPGMVAGMSRHLRSLRRMQPDQGWIETLLEEAENERMHLMTFLHLKKPGYLMRLMTLVGQGVFFNAFFLAYMLSPRTAHRFVGYLEEEAVLTYTRCVQDIDAGLLPEWATGKAPEMAIRYWKMPEDATIRDLIVAVRSDEAKHRSVNHSLANLGQDDANPFVLEHESPLIRHAAEENIRYPATGMETATKNAS